jgi:mannonate dehydratase
MSDENLTLAAQCGVTDIVTRYVGPSLDDLSEVKHRVECFGLRVSVVEGYLPLENIKIGRDNGFEFERMTTLVEHMGQLGIQTLCYNFMAGTDWVRTRLDAPERGGAKVTAFDLRDAQRAVLLGHDGAHADHLPSVEQISADALWKNLEAFLVRIVPFAERAGVVLAMHPERSAAERIPWQGADHESRREL